MNTALGIVATVTSTATTGGIDAIVVAWHTALHGLQHLASLLGQQSTQLVDTRCRTVECGDNSGGGWRGSYACIRPQHTANTVVTVATIVTVAGTSAFVVTHAGTGTEPFNTTISGGVQVANSSGGWRGSHAGIRPLHTANTVVTVVTVAGTSAFVVTHAGTGTEPFNTTVSRGVHGGTVV